MIAGGRGVINWSCSIEHWLNFEFLRIAYFRPVYLVYSWTYFQDRPAKWAFCLKIPKRFCWLEKNDHLRSEKNLFRDYSLFSRQHVGIMCFSHHESPCWNRGGQALTALANGPNSHASNLDNAEASVNNSRADRLKWCFGIFKKNWLNINQLGIAEWVVSLVLWFPFPFDWELL